ncbi:HAMP domain-containing histidine kinase [Aeromicrobium fastidiosum]|uniref:sensor histidine kinase n=1 Tax=Aeromicrobium fastidiosum TaxID=52699 RepID=UPI0020233F74|nr:HAMP domain-containing sensor histidine kinase [Aeromicrobium fastidiosum]MCL8252258.1 HAMP domain-containing histidine kinase [Aeromicrobium fastidiosum]
MRTSVRERVRTRSLRTRTVASVLLVLTALLLVLGVAVDTALGSRLRGEIEQRLQDRVETAQALSGSVSDDVLVRRLSGQGVSAYLRSADGEVHTSGPSPEEITAQTDPGAGAGAGAAGPPPTRGRGTPGPPDPTATSGRIVEMGSVLTLDAELTDGSIVRVAADSSQVEATLAQLRTVLVTASAAALLLAAAVLTVVVRRSLSPLDDMTRVARSITSGDRGRRLRPDRPRTDIGRTASAFDEMLDEVEGAEQSALQAEQRLRDFLSDAAHELRTPVTGMQAAAESLLRNQTSRADREMLAVQVVREARHAARLVDDMLLMSRVDQGLDLVREPLDLVAAARSAASRPLPLGGTVVDVTGDEAWVSADADRVAQVLGNLLANASRVAEHVRVDVRTDGPQVVLEVTDDGPGVPPADRERIFERMVRLDEGRDRHAGGVGLGLPVARGIAEAHGGRLTCEDSPVGARFRLTLPATSGSRRAPAGAFGVKSLA